MMDFKDEVKDLIDFLGVPDTDDNRRMVTLQLEKVFILGEQSGLTEAQSIIKDFRKMGGMK